MHPWGAGSDDHPIDRKFTDVFFDKVLSGVGTKIAVITGYFYSGEHTGKKGESLTIDRSSDIGATVTDIDTDLLFHQIKSQ
jgi:hypothetical protein